MTTEGESRENRAIETRKAQHLAHAQGDVESRRPARWDDIELVHHALPELDFDGVDLTASFLGRQLRAPIVLAAMTGGHAEAHEINARIARAAERYGLAMGVGSQRVALRSPATAYTYEVAREQAPTALLIGNIGAAQLVEQDGEVPLTLSDVRRAIEMIRADALAVHLNFLEEIVQPEGNRSAQGCLAAIRELVNELGDETPVIAKETGAGLSSEVAGELAGAGVAALDVGGRGGTSFAAIEGRRAREGEHHGLARLGEVFRDWGIPTPVSVAASAKTGLPIIATGGVRSGLDAAKAIALGATMVGIARPVLLAAVQGDEMLNEMIEQFQSELRAAMFLTRCKDLATLAGVSLIITGETERWMHGLSLRIGEL